MWKSTKINLCIPLPVVQFATTHHVQTSRPRQCSAPPVCVRRRRVHPVPTVRFVCGGVSDRSSLTQFVFEDSPLMMVDGVVAVMCCTTMALFYVGILYAPTFILRLPPPPSYKVFLIRRFISAAISSSLSLLLSALILLPIRHWEASHLLELYGIRLSSIWQAVVFPLCLTSLMYAGSIVHKFMLIVDSCKEQMNHNGGLSFQFVKDILAEFHDWIYASATNVLVWRNYVVAPLTEELVFRACMIPLLLCGGFRIYTVIFLCPVFFSLGLQLGYTVIFGSYASFLFIRTGNLASSLVAHIFCNFMGLPLLFSRRTGMEMNLLPRLIAKVSILLNYSVSRQLNLSGILNFVSGFVTVAFVCGMLSFIWLLFPMTRPDLYNDRTNNCRCWHGYCSWN
ncbi:hypothetical protein ACFE04_020094 [Oxalis oulophora]